MTSTIFEERYLNHKKSFEDPRYAKSTELSKHIWSLKNMKRSCNIKWTILSRRPTEVVKKMEIMPTGKATNFKKG